MCNIKWNTIKDQILKARTYINKVNGVTYVMKKEDSKSTDIILTSEEKMEYLLKDKRLCIQLTEKIINGIVNLGVVISLVVIVCKCLDEPCVLFDQIKQFFG